MQGKGCTHTLQVEGGHGWRMLQKVRTHPLQDENDVSSEFISDKREGRTRCEWMASVLDLNMIKGMDAPPGR